MFVPENISKVRVPGVGKGSAFSEGVTGPSHAPEGDKDFEFVMETGEREQHSQEEWADVALLGEKAQKALAGPTKGPKQAGGGSGSNALAAGQKSSLFELSRSSNKAAKAVNMAAMPAAEVDAAADIVAASEPESEAPAQYSTVTLGAAEAEHPPGRSALKISVEEPYQQGTEGSEKGAAAQAGVYTAPKEAIQQKKEGATPNTPNSSNNGNGTSATSAVEASTAMASATQAGQQELEDVVAKNKTTQPLKKTTYPPSTPSAPLSEHHPSAMTVNTKAGLQAQPQSGPVIKSTKPAGKASEAPKGEGSSTTAYILPKEAEGFIVANDEAEAVPSSMMSGMEKEHEKLSFGIAAPQQQQQVAAGVMPPGKMAHQNQSQAQAQMQSQGPSGSAIFWGQGEHGSEAGKIQNSQPPPAKASTAELMGKSQKSGGNQQDSGSNERNSTPNKIVATAPSSAGTVKVTQSAKLPSGEVVETSSSVKIHDSVDVTLPTVAAAEEKPVKPLPPAVTARDVVPTMAATTAAQLPKGGMQTARHGPIELAKEAGSAVAATVSSATAPTSVVPASPRKGIGGGNLVGEEIAPDVNLLMAEQVAPRYVTVDKAAEVPSVSRVPELQAIVDRLVKSIQQLEIAGKTDTVIDLKEGDFAGSRITISEFNSSKKQLNITIDNLTQQSKLLVDLPENRTALLHALSERGYTIQMMVTTTALVDTTPILSDAARQGQQQQEESRGGNKQQEQQQRQEQQRDKPAKPYLS